MADFKQILIAVDFSDVSAAALKTGLDLAGKLGAEVRVVHAVPVVATGVPLEGGAVYIEDLHAELVAESKEKLSQFLAGQGATDKVADASVRSGEPPVEITRAAQEAGVDLIVMGTHGRTGLRHLLMGSVAESVLRETKIPVLCVHG
jgi:nucleotide-binding universal stress UspA family protein